MVDYGLEKKSASKMAGKEIVRSGRYACAAEAKTARAAESKEGRRWEGKGGGSRYGPLPKSNVLVCACRHQRRSILVYLVVSPLFGTLERWDLTNRRGFVS